MESIVIDIRNEKDKFLFLALAERLKLRSKIFTDEEKEEIGLIKAMKEGKNSGKADEVEIMKSLDK
ncbi:MAG: hypothetical protein A2275_15070 [Bacteroidetes bacterium RIFOXYA12_FULL_35_11]|nr:MAG: hypothetical protein A2X01_17975 [Bacteroidetes bacterium GWF2_35_48]OFY80187.1 MAG: hypothetical protein A2275_15070 [Bacteroidetes bacterium RIFOXYA12_FULL_35_11]OFY93514.1 MAG: hypothetical protein A2491_09415 [Bacteroidetes bacterium RIFOXYC12_FULL_35_7]OFY94573.1 MAG: hypothetical protein A2309_04340 [Bacteroidetes bacterium RIFOXYB2_FULL_35_7]HBX51733.1 hypothetical protein [Bacteroidales bacterium]